MNVIKCSHKQRPSLHYTATLMDRSAPEILLLEMARATTLPNMQEARTIINQCHALSGSREDGYTALHWAAFNGHEELARYLVALGADITAQTSRDHYYPAQLAATVLRTPSLHSSINVRKERIYDFLLRSGTPYHDLGDETPRNLRDLRDHWLSECSDTWKHWNETHRPLGQLTPALLCKFCSHGTAQQVLETTDWTQHPEMLRALLSSSEIAPCHVQHWLYAIPRLNDYFTQPDTCILPSTSQQMSNLSQPCHPQATR